jgi:hypothetical protein
MIRVSKYVSAFYAIASLVVTSAAFAAEPLSTGEVQALVTPGKTLAVTGVGKVRVLDSAGRAEIIGNDGRKLTFAMVRDGGKLCFSDPMLPYTAGVKGGGASCLSFVREGGEVVALANGRTLKAVSADDTTTTVATRNVQSPGSVLANASLKHKTAN